MEFALGFLVRKKVIIARESFEDVVLRALLREAR